MSAHDASPAPRWSVADVRADAAHAHPGLVDAILRGEHDVALIREVLAPEAADEVAARLEAAQASFPRSSFPPQFRAHFLGRCLDLSDPSLDAYFDDAEAYQAASARLFEGILDFRTRITALFDAIGGGREVKTPIGPGGRAYAESTIRFMHEGGFIPPHCEHEQALRPPYAHLRTLIQPEAMLSFYLVLAAPEGGGELCMSDLRFSSLGEAHMHNQRTNVAELVRVRPSAAFAPRAGDVILFHGGERIHWVSPCVGPRLRWTMGGFAAPASTGSVLYFWS